MRQDFMAKIHACGTIRPSMKLAMGYSTGLPRDVRGPPLALR